MFPPNLSVVDYNDDGEPTGWSVPSDDPPEPDADDEECE